MPLSQGAKVVLGSAAVLGALVYHTKHRRAAEAEQHRDYPPYQRPQRERTRAAAIEDVIAEHGKGAAKDVLKVAGEVGDVAVSHGVEAVLDAATMTKEIGKVLTSGPEAVTRVNVRDTIAVTKDQVPDSIRSVELPAAQAKRLPSLPTAAAATGAAAGGAAPPSRAAPPPNRGEGGALAAATAAQQRRSEQTVPVLPQQQRQGGQAPPREEQGARAPPREQTSDEATAAGSQSAWTGKEHSEAAAQDLKRGASEMATIAAEHGGRAVQDVKAAARDVKEALVGDAGARETTVQHTPSLTRQESRLEPTEETRRTSSRDKPEPGVLDRVKEAGSVVKEHAKAAASDVSRAGQEASAVTKEHASTARQDVADARREVATAGREQRLVTPAPRQTPPPVSPPTVDGTAVRKAPMERGGGERGEQQEEAPRMQPSLGTVALEHGKRASRDVREAVGDIKRALVDEGGAGETRVEQTPPLTPATAMETPTPGGKGQPVRVPTRPADASPPMSFDDRMAEVAKIAREHARAAMADLYRAQQEAAAAASSAPGPSDKRSPAEAGRTARGDDQQQQQRLSEAEDAYSSAATRQERGIHQRDSLD